LFCYFAFYSPCTYIGSRYFYHQGRRLRHDLPHLWTFSTLSCLPVQFDPIVSSPTSNNKELILLLAAFEASYHDMSTPISPNMVFLVIDTGARITATPYLTDIFGPIDPVQSVEIKGITSGQ